MIGFSLLLEYLPIHAQFLPRFVPFSPEEILGRKGFPGCGNHPQVSGDSIRIFGVNHSWLTEKEKRDDHVQEIQSLEAQLQRKNTDYGAKLFMNRVGLDNANVLRSSRIRASMKLLMIVGIPIWMVTPIGAPVLLNDLGLPGFDSNATINCALKKCR